jgi:hypothetical protein
MEANLSLSEGGTGRGDAIARAGSSTVSFAAEPIAAAPAPTRMKSRRVIESFAIRVWPPCESLQTKSKHLG